MIDSIPWWFAIPAGVIASITYMVIEIRHAAPDPDPQYSPLDHRDGLPRNG